MTIEEMGALQVDRPAPLEARPSENTQGFRRVLVALDGSPVAEAIMPFVSRIAGPLGLEMVLFRAVPAVPPRVVEGTRPIIIDNSERLQQEADDYLRTMAERLSAQGFRVATAVRVGDAATQILEGARECHADLIAMTTHGRGALGRLLFGSVAEAVLHRAHIPVFIRRVTENQSAEQVA